MSGNSADSFFTQGTEQVYGGLDRDMQAHLHDAALTPNQRLAIACRILADEGHARTLAGQITVRLAESDTYWTTHFGYGLAEACVGNLVRVDQNMAIVEGNGMPSPAVRFHLWIYRARPNINCIVHTHPPYVSALGLTGEDLFVGHMDTAMFHDDCAQLRDWPGVPLANEEGRIISEALGDKRSILLAHHGLLTTGKTLEEAVYLAVQLEYAARMQVEARSMADRLVPIKPDLAAKAHDFLLGSKMITATFDYWARRAARRHPDALR